ncbi:MAG: PadR family transcriptional regulator [Saprospiraceae bacterium]|nr:PadR family transcriptional regulator [Saprospiraceae bacterium]
MNIDQLGYFEEQVLTMVAILGEDAYGNAIAEEFANQLNKTVNLSSVHVTLYRLEDKGMVKSMMGGATAVRGGRRKRIFTISSAGLNTLRNLKDSREQLWKLVPQFKISY